MHLLLFIVAAGAASFAAAQHGESTQGSFLRESLLDSPTLPAWKEVKGGPSTMCSHGTDWSFMVREGRSDRLVVEFQGGGCCFNLATCLSPVYTRTVDVQETLAMLSKRGGIGGAHEGNPILNWTHVFLPYCTGDAFLGNNTPSYGVHHVGRVNYLFAMDWVRDNLPQVNPEVVVVTGESAGAVASYVLAPNVFSRFPDARHVHFADSYAPLFGKTGYNDGVVHWHSNDAYDPKVNQRLQELNISLTEWSPYLAARATAVTAEVFPNVSLASYVSNSDSVEEGFYVVEGCGADGCDWKKAMRTALNISRSQPNFASFIGRGSQHVVTQDDGMYERSDGDVKFVDWLTDLVAGNPLLPNVDCQPDCS
eukprot:INCI30.1.p1 GENE.INCI30.1~~INCI30.1.p1  ORF type:complete len:405 (-),score=60.25 INCI30.1:150-1247(-)